jgi:DNA repair exonuclease SbcCD ATPase subunit
MSIHALAVRNSPCLPSVVRLAASVGVLLVALAGPPALAQSSQTAPGAGASDAVAPVEEFSRQLEELKKTFADLSKRIESSAKAIDNATDPVASRRELEDLRGIVSALLGAVADNGEVARLGSKALEHARAKQKSLREDTRFTPEQRDFLLRQWDKLGRDTEAATAELDAARARFAKVLRTLQINDDYVGELMELRQGNEALKVVRDLARQIHEASDMLNNFINTLTAPQPGT